MNPIPQADSDAWNLAEGTSDGMPSIVRYRPNLKSFLGDPRYPRRLTITWSFKDPNQSGMPSKNESDQIRSFEDALLAALDRGGLAIIAFVHTHGGLRRWHYYLSDVDAVGQRINQALSGSPILPIELVIEDDPEWQELRMVLAACGEQQP